MSAVSVTLRGSGTESDSESVFSLSSSRLFPSSPGPSRVTDPVPLLSVVRNRRWQQVNRGWNTMPMPYTAATVTTGAGPMAGVRHLGMGGQNCVDAKSFGAFGFTPEPRHTPKRKHEEAERVAIDANALVAQENASLERGLLPAPALREDDFTAAWCYVPGRTHALLGGDFYDIVQTDDSSVHVILGDVSVHGAAEAALAVHLRVAWRTAVLCGKDQFEQLCILERILVDERADDDMYTTVVSLVFPPGGLSVRAVSAGHLGFLLRSPGEFRWVEPRTGIGLGLFPGCEDWTGTDIPLSPHDSVVLFTDGLFEGRTAPSTRLGEEGLLRLAKQHAHLPGQEFIDALVHGAASQAAPFGGLGDDVAVLHLGWNTES
ncbi:serine/threonine-protein phosphatase [Streptomyces sp. tea 10]|nr:serine/threonine-protein phosphatase [Streptomyces sp. tea 10]